MKSIIKVLSIMAIVAACFATRSTSVFAATAGFGARDWQQRKNESALSREELLTQEYKCALSVMKAGSLVVAKKRRAACQDTFIVRASYAWWLTKNHSPAAVDAVISAAPKSSAEMVAFYSIGEVSSLGDQVRAEYYDALFHAGQARPDILPVLFLIASQFGTDNPNVDEEIWFCQKLHKLYKVEPNKYMRALNHVTNAYSRRYALDCRRGP